MGVCAAFSRALLRTLLQQSGICYNYLIINNFIFQGCLCVSAWMARSDNADASPRSTNAGGTATRALFPRRRPCPSHAPWRADGSDGRTPRDAGRDGAAPNELRLQRRVTQERATRRARIVPAAAGQARIAII
jgi:hypothetical protein